MVIDLGYYHVMFCMPQFEELEDRAKSNQGDLEKVRSEVNDYRKQVTTLEMELESLRGTVRKVMIRHRMLFVTN